MKTQANGITVNYTVDGPEGAPWVTFSHSICCDLSMWDMQVDQLKRNYRVLRYDIRGHGGSDVPEGSYDFDMLVDDVIGLWDALNIERSHFVGLSLGAMMGYGLGAAHGHRLRSLVAADGRAVAPRAYAEYFDERIAIMEDGGMEALVEHTVERWFRPDFLKREGVAVDKIREMIRRTAPAGHVGCCRAVQKLAYEHRLKEIRVPTLVLGGDEDKGAPPEALAEIAAAIPGACHTVIEQSGHITNIENPGAFGQAVEEFLGSTGKP